MLAQPLPPEVSPRSFVIGQLASEQAEAVRMALSRAGLGQTPYPDARAARRALADPSAAPPAMMLVDATSVALDTFMGWVRGQGRLFGAMVVAIVPRPSDQAFVEAIAAGCDDVVVAGDLGAITRRAAILRTYDPTLRPPVTEGAALIAHPSDQRRRLLGRVLRLAGFEVRFAIDEGELAAAVARETPALLVSAVGLPTHGLPAIVVGSEGEIRALEAEGLDGSTATLSEHAPPDALLFVANELLRPGVQDIRASERVLFDSLCAFRPAGQLHPVLGVTYNISKGGLYVRTLDPPRRDTSLWFELRPPRSRDVVHLRGTVMWARDMGHGPGGAAPPGFGVRIEADACPVADLEAYHGAYHDLRSHRDPDEPRSRPPTR